MRRTMSSVAVAITSLCACLVVGSSTDATAAHTVKTKDKPTQGCSVEAGGSLSGKRSFELEAEFERGKLEGELEFSDKTAKLEFESTSITNLVVAGKLASVQGWGKTKAKGSATLRFSATLDAAARTFALNLSSGYSTSGALAAKGKGKGDDDDDHELELDGSCPFDGASTPVLDAPQRISATIGRAGGTLGSAGLTLTIPAGALSADTAIALTPLLDLADSPLAGTIIRGAKLEPEGLRFLRPAALTFALPAGTAAGDVIGFGSAGDGSDLHLQPHTLAGGTISLPLWHFSTAGGSSGGSSAAAAVQRPISNAERQAMQRIAAAYRACNTEMARGILNGPGCNNVRPESVRALFDWFATAVRPGLQAAASAPSFAAEAALAEWLAWEAEVVLVYRNDPAGTPRCGILDNECDVAKGLATTAVAAHAQLRLNNCTGTSLIPQLRDVARMADFAGAGAIDLTSVGLPSATNGDLLRECAHLDIAITDFPAVAALNIGNTLRGRVTVDVYSGPNRTDVPFTLTADNSFVSAAADGSFVTTLTPRSSPLNVTVEAEAVNPTLQNTDFTTRRFLVRNARARLQLVAQSPTTVAAGGTINLLVRVAGDGMAGMAVVLGGPGTTSPSSITTNSQGEANAAFTVLSNATNTNDFVTAVLPDGTEESLPITVSVNVTVSISPTSASLSTGGSRTFTAAVTNSFLGVTWSASGGVIVNLGNDTARYDAGQTPGTFTVTATSIADPTKSAAATVTVTGTPAGQVTFLSSDGAASGGGSFASGDPNDPPVSNGSGEFGDPDAPSDSGSGSGSVGGTCHPGLGGGAASGSGSGSFSYSAEGGSNLTSIQVQANASASSGSSGCTAAGGAEARAIVTFQVSGAPMPYSLTASSSGGAGSGCGYRTGSASITLPNGLVIRSTSGQGVLAAGFYRLHTLATAGSCAPQGGSFSGNGSARLDFGP